MYIIKESGKGKLYCYTEGCFPLNDNLKQSVLKKLFNDKCPHIDYERTETTTEEASTQFESVPEKDTEDKSNGNARRKANKRKTNKERKAD